MLFYYFSGNLRLQKQLEELMANFLGVQSCICFPMGFATNSMNLPSFVLKVCTADVKISHYPKIGLGRSRSNS